MAAMDDIPTVKEGQSWSSWADIVGFRNSENEDEEEDPGKEKNWKKRRENDAMKLRKEEMELFGYCPTWDDFFLVVCELCGRVVKPQAFCGHLEYRHGTSSHSNRENASTPQHQHQHHGKNSSGNSGSIGGGSSGGSGPIGPSPSQNRSGNSSNMPVPNRSSASSGSLYPNQVVIAGTKSSSMSNSQSSSSNTSKLSVAKMVHSHFAPNTNNNVGNNTPEPQTNKSSKADSKSKKNHSIDPVVRVERMPSIVVMKKTTGSPSSVHSGDNRRDLSSSPLVAPDMSPNSFSTLPHGLSNDVDYLKNSPSKQVLYEGTSGPGPGEAGFTRIHDGSVNLAVSSSNAQRKIAMSSRPVGEVLKKSLPVPAEGHLAGQSGVTSNRKPSKTKKVSKERKLVLCKDREYDANKHCGVTVAESGKPCTRSLTCKTHSLSLRRAVAGRLKHFDELLSEHRAAKEAVLKPPPTTSQSNMTSGGAASNSQACSSTSLDHQGSAGPKPGQGSSKLNHNQAIANLQRVLNSSGRVSKVNSGGVSKVTHHSPTGTSSTSSVSTSSQNHSLQRVTGSKISSTSSHSEPAPASNLDLGKSPNPESATKNHSAQRIDLPYITHHPRPAAVCSFGVRRMASGVFLSNRYLDSTRSALEMAFLHEKGAQVPPKKLCPEAGLLPIHDSVEPSDPYSFTCFDLSGVNESNDSGSSLAPSPTYTSVKSNTSNNSAVSAIKGNQILTNNKVSSATAPLQPPNSSLFISHNSVLTSARTSTESDGGNSGNLSAVKRTSKSKLANAVNKLKRIKSSGLDDKTNCDGQNALLPSLSSAAKKRRTCTTGNPSNSTVPTTASNRQSGTNPQTVTLTALSSPNLCSAGGQTRSMPLSFPFIGERLGALSRLQVSAPFGNRNSLPIAPAVLRHTGSALVNNSVLTSGVPNHVNSSLKDSLFLTGVDVINGQLPGTTALLHSVTVSRASDSIPTTLLAAPSTGGLGITLGTHSAGLVNQLSRFQQNIPTNSNKPIDSSPGLSSAKGAKCKARKTSGRSNSGVGAQANRTFSSPLNLGLSLLLDGGPGALSSAHVASSTGIQISSGNSPSNCPSPQLRMDTRSPGVSSPTVNGRGPSPTPNYPPLFTPNKNVFVSGTTSLTSNTISGTNVRLSPASRASTPSPDCLSSQNSYSVNATKGKNKHGSSYSKSVSALNAGNIAFPTTPPLNIAPLPTGTTSSSQPITYQQVFTSQMLTQAQLNQLQFHSPTTVPSKNNKSVSKGNAATSAQQLTLPLKLLASSTSTGGQQHRHLLLSDDSRRKDLQQDSQSLST